MTTDQICKYECDNLILLTKELEKTYIKYEKINSICINKIFAEDSNKYTPPECMSNFDSFLISSILIQVQGLLDHLIPKILKFDENNGCHKKGNILDKVKEFSRQNQKKYEFVISSQLFNDLKLFYYIRNDQVHSGGYCTYGEPKRLAINKLKGVNISNISELYIIKFEYCISVIRTSRSFLLEIYNKI